MPKNSKCLLLLLALAACGTKSEKTGPGPDGSSNLDGAVWTGDPVRVGDAGADRSPGLLTDAPGADKPVVPDAGLPGDAKSSFDTARADQTSLDLRAAQDSAVLDTRADSTSADARTVPDVLSGNDAVGATWWKPVAGTTWQWQIGGGTIDPTMTVQVFDLDWEIDASVVQSLHAAGKKGICYVSVGSWEDWRPDAAQFPSTVIGKDYPGWPGEKFVDIRAQALRDIMAKRLETCRQKGFDAVEPDNMDVFEATSGFPLTRSDGIDYALWLAAESHQRGMAIVQKNASSIVADIRAGYDGALTEDCYDAGWCGDMQPYLDHDQPVFACEYNNAVFTAACTWGKAKKVSFILKKEDLGAWIQVCP